MRGIFVAACLLTCLTACSVPVAGTPQPAASVPHPTSSAAPPPFKSPDKVTAACPFVGVHDIVAAVGGAWSATVSEQPPKKDGPFTTYTCVYTSEFHDAAAFQLFVATGPADRSPGQMADDWAKQGCTTAAVAIPGAGEKALYCDLPDATVDGMPEQVTTVIVAAHSHGESRIAELDLHKIRADVYTKIATLLAGRL